MRLIVMHEFTSITNVSMRMLYLLVTNARRVNCARQLRRKENNWKINRNGSNTAKRVLIQIPH